MVFFFFDKVRGKNTEAVFINKNQTSTNSWQTKKSDTKALLNYTCFCI